MGLTEEEKIDRINLGYSDSRIIERAITLSSKENVTMTYDEVVTFLEGKRDYAINRIMNR